MVLPWEELLLIFAPTQTKMAGVNRWSDSSAYYKTQKDGCGVYSASVIDYWFVFLLKETT